MDKPKYDQLEKKDKADTLSMQIRDAFETMSELLKLASQSELYEGSDKPFNLYYKDKQNHLNQFRKECTKIVNTNVKELKKEVKKGLKDIDMTNKQIKSITNEMEAKANNLGMVFFRQHNQWMNQIKTTYKVDKKDILKVESLHQEIANVFQANPSIANLKVTMKDKTGKVRLKADGTPMQEKYESYIERTVRTEIHSSIGQNLVKAGQSLGQVFYICSYFGDSRKEHADYQGKYYYDESWEDYIDDEGLKNKIQAYIDSHKLMSIQEGQSDAIGLSTWCNCRHTFDYVDIDTVLDTKTEDDLAKVRDEYNFNQNGDYDKAKNDALNKQRYYERGIREWKNRKDEAELNLSTLPKDASPQERAKAMADVLQARQKVAEWQKAQRQHIEQANAQYGGFLSRDYNRENPNDIYDMGVHQQIVPKTPTPKTSDLKRDVKKLKKQIKEEGK